MPAEEDHLREVTDRGRLKLNEISAGPRPRCLFGQHRPSPLRRGGIDPYQGLPGLVPSVLGQREPFHDLQVVEHGAPDDDKRAIAFPVPQLPADKVLTSGWRDNARPGVARVRLATRDVGHGRNVSRGNVHMLASMVSHAWLLRGRSGLPVHGRRSYPPGLHKSHLARASGVLEHWRLRGHRLLRHGGCDRRVRGYPGRPVPTVTSRAGRGLRWGQIGALAASSARMLAGAACCSCSVMPVRARSSPGAAPIRPAPRGAYAALIRAVRRIRARMPAK